MLYQLLTDAQAIRILKLLYDEEFVKKENYALNLSEIASRPGFNGNLMLSIGSLDVAGLIQVDSLKEDKVLSITPKGRKFIEIFDQLRAVLLQKKQEKKKEKRIQVKYELSSSEKKLIDVLKRVGKDGDPVEISELTIAMYPEKGHKKKRTSVLRFVSRLEKLNLVEKIERGDELLVKLVTNQ